MSVSEMTWLEVEASEIVQGGVEAPVCLPQAARSLYIGEEAREPGISPLWRAGGGSRGEGSRQVHTDSQRRRRGQGACHRAWPRIKE